jgi:hypothetical protein
LREKRFAFAQAVLGGLLCCDVLGHAGDTKYGAGIIDDGNGAGVEDADLRVWQHEANFVLEGTSIFDEGFDFLGDTVAIVGVKQCTGLSERH